MRNRSYQTKEYTAMLADNFSYDIYDLTSAELDELRDEEAATAIERRERRRAAIEHRDRANRAFESAAIYNHAERVAGEPSTVEDLLYDWRVVGRIGEVRYRYSLDLLAGGGR